MSRKNKYIELWNAIIFLLLANRSFPVFASAGESTTQEFNLFTKILSNIPEWLFLLIFSVGISLFLMGVCTICIPSEIFREICLRAIYFVVLTAFVIGFFCAVIQWFWTWTQPISNLMCYFYGFDVSLLALMLYIAGITVPESAEEEMEDYE